MVVWLFIQFISGNYYLGGQENGILEFGKEEQGVKVLGGGCKKCDQLDIAAIEALESLGIDTSIEHVRDLKKLRHME